MLAILILVTIAPLGLKKEEDLGLVIL